MDLSLHSLTLETREERETFENSRISELPDDILIHILSFVTMKEAGRTSLLSKRWRYVRAYIRYLDFDSYGALDESFSLENYVHSLEETEPIYFGWVDQVVNSHKAPTIDEFKVKYDLGVSRQDNIDNWLKFAMEKRVKRLELNVAPAWAFSNPLLYTFPSLPFNSLTFLQLYFVHVSGEILEKLLRDCQTLEFLSVARSDLVVDLKVAGLNLISLTILQCNEIKHLEISAPNLKFFNYEGPSISSPFKSIPKLTELNIAGSYADQLLASEFLDLSSFISQIEVLSILPLNEVKRMSEVFPKATMIKTLHIQIDPCDDVQLFRLRFLLSACPFLHRFVLQLQFYGRRYYTSKRTTSVKACPHFQLKILEIVNFVGCELDSTFARFLIESAVSLEKMIIEPTIISTWEKSGLQREEIATQEAEKLRAKLKPGIAFQIRNSADRYFYKKKLPSDSSFCFLNIGGVA